MQLSLSVSNSFPHFFICLSLSLNLGKDESGHLALVSRMQDVASLHSCTGTRAPAPSGRAVNL